MNGILKMSNSNKNLIIKLEDLISIDFSQDIEVSIDNSSYPDSANIRLNGRFVKDIDSFTYEAGKVSSAIVSLSMGDFVLPDNVDFITISMTIQNGDNEYKFPIYITNNTLDQYKIYDK